MPEFFEHAKRLKFCPKTVIDVGVAYGTPALYNAFPDAYYLLFEPVAEFEPGIKEILKGLQGEYRMCALADQPRATTLFRGAQPDGGSLMHRGIQTEDPRLRPVEVHTLDELLGGRTLEEPILLKTDCQGGDLSVIKGSKAFLHRCEMVVMEVGMFNFWSPETPDFTDTIEYMRGEGYVTYDLLEPLLRPSDDALGQIDVVFVKKNGVFRSSHIW
jgi:FkbM family methyltransferase